MPARVSEVAGLETGIYAGLSLWELRSYVFNRSIAHEPAVQSKPLLEYTPRQAVLWRELPELPFAPVRRTGLLGAGDSRVLAWSSHERRVAYRSDTPGQLWISTYYHPGWEARLGDDLLPVAAAQGSGLVIAEVPAGEHEVVFRFAATPARRAGAAISGLTALGLLALAATRLRPSAARVR